MVYVCCFLPPHPVLIPNGFFRNRARYLHISYALWANQVWDSFGPEAMLTCLTSFIPFFRGSDLVWALAGLQLPCMLFIVSFSLVLWQLSQANFWWGHSTVYIYVLLCSHSPREFGRPVFVLWPITFKSFYGICWQIHIFSIKLNLPSSVHKCQSNYWMCITNSW